MVRLIYRTGTNDSKNMGAWEKRPRKEGYYDKYENINCVTHGHISIAYYYFTTVNLINNKIKQI